MTGFRTFTVAPKVPENLAFLQRLANNVWWCWNVDATNLFRRVNPTILKEVEFNPVRLLSHVGQERLEELSADQTFLAHMKRVQAQFEKEVLTSRNWKKPGDTNYRCIAYFSMEFGLHESIHIYSGGLGLLAGDHLKSASDLDIPLVGIGLFYREGYFEQAIDASGWQIEGYPENKTQNLPVTRCLDSKGAPLLLSVPLADGPLHFTAWKLDVGRIPLILLDTNIPENRPELRSVTGQLYGGDKVNRLRQEVLLGVGGLRAVEALGYEVAVSHMNEGHAAFLGPERVAKTMQRNGLSLAEALEFVRRSSVFTTHTPVPAGNETFPLSLLWPQLEALEKEGGVPAETVKGWGRAPEDQSDELSMTILGLRCSLFNNGVAALHGVVERNMWHHLWPDFPVEEVPIGSVTNGVHVPTWISTDNSRLYGAVLGPDWDKVPVTPRQAAKIDHVPDEELWRVHEAGRAHLVRSAREILERSARRRDATPAEIEDCRNVLDKDALTIGFARRFATYKRATLLLADPARLKRLLLNPARPVQIVFAGKAHPADNEGKALIRRIVEFSRDPELKGKIVFLENYNIHIARRLVRGVDVWLNTPRRPMEASGTSGMKATINGAIHVSTRDGWWPEGYAPENGWAIGKETEYSDWNLQDASDSQSLYNILESEVVPTFYDRPHGELPLRWIAMMKASIKMALSKFSSTRMVAEYFKGSYAPALENYATLSAGKFKALRDDVAERETALGAWSSIRVEAPVADRDLTRQAVGDSFQVSTRVHLGSVSPESIRVELFLGRTDPQGNVTAGTASEMQFSRKEKDGTLVYTGEVSCAKAGAFAFSARVVPVSTPWRTAMPGYVVWADDPK